MTAAQPSPEITAQEISAQETIAQIGELALIERLKTFCAAEAIGDDAALMTVQAGYQLVVTTDMLTDHVHFSDRTTPPYTVGWRAVAANLSDLAAMGAMPLGITVSLGLPGQTAWAWVAAVYQGMADCLAQYGGAIVGGDLCRAQQRTVSITALGEVSPHQVIRRDAAIAGMSIVVTGPHGASRAGLALLLAEIAVEGRIEGRIEGAAEAAQGWIEAHQKPKPRFDVIASLRQLMQNEVPYPAIAGMDSSDGLANALLQISTSSGVGMDIVRSLIPLPPKLSTTVGTEIALEWALYGGEDFELVLCLAPEFAQKLVQTGLATAIGTTTHSRTVQLCADDQSSPIPIVHQSFQHFG